MKQNIDQNIDGLDFEPADPDLVAALKSARKVLEDPRDYEEATNDVIDQRLFKALHEAGVFEANEFSADAMIAIARAGYIKAFRDLMYNPQITEQILKAMAKEGPGLKVLKSHAEN